MAPSQGKGILIPHPTDQSLSEFRWHPTSRPFAPPPKGYNPEGAKDLLNYWTKLTSRSLFPLLDLSTTSHYPGAC